MAALELTCNLNAEYSFARFHAFAAV